MSSSMGRLLLACLCELRFRRRPERGVAFPRVRIGFERRFIFLVGRTGESNGFRRPRESGFAWLYASDFLGGCRDPGERRAEIGEIDQRKQQPRHPKKAHMFKKRKETTD